MVTGDRGAKIVDLDAARVARLGRSLAAVLDGGYVIADVSTVANADEWRKAARAIALAQGWRIRTGVTRDGSRVWAARLDRATTEQDRAVLRDRLDYMSALLGRPQYASTTQPACSSVGRQGDIVEASFERLATHGWVVGPPLEAEAWRRRVKAAARQRGWRLATGGVDWYPWAARTDLDDEQGTPWNRLGLHPRSFFDMYPPEA